MRFREDIEGLRGVAVLLVVVFHVGWSGLEGGFIGVDVFFVISGFLISSQIVEQLEGEGRFRIGTFWSRRLKRLMPLLAITVLVTLVVSVMIYSPLFWGQVARESLSSILYVSNVQFARDNSYYFQSGTSPLLHTWSLSVEEQFYVGWPLILAAVGVLTRKHRRLLRPLLFATISAVTVASIVVSLLLTRRGSPWAFFISPSRAWEFGIGALLMLALRGRAPARAVLAGVAGWLGLIVLLAAGTIFDSTTEMPGTAAWVPVIGTSLILFAGTASPKFGVGVLLGCRPMMWLGRVSYGWYLFHWPAIVLAAAALQRSSLTVSVVAATVSLGLAAAAHVFVERPVRHQARLARPIPVFAATALSILLIAGCVSLVQRAAADRLKDPYLSMLLDTRERRTLWPTGECKDEVLASGQTVCVYGLPTSEVTVLLLGDSHAAQWFPAMTAIADSQGFRLVVSTRGGCPAFDVAVMKTGGSTASVECRKFRLESRQLLKDLQPTLVVLGNADYTSRLLSAPDGDLLGREDALSAWGAAASQLGGELADLGAAVSVIENNPTQERDPIECLARGNSISVCSTPAAHALPFLHELAESEQAGLQTQVKISVFHVAPLMCDDQLCLAERDGVVNYSDADHLSVQFVEAQTAELDAVIRSTLERLVDG